MCVYTIVMNNGKYRLNVTVAEIFKSNTEKLSSM